MAERIASMADKAAVYRHYMRSVDRPAAARILLGLVALVVAAEVVARVVDYRSVRTANSSLHGVRSIFRDAISSDAPKVILLGDSTSVGGGVFDHKAIVAERMRAALAEKKEFYNLAIPAGDNSTSLLIADALKTQGARNVDRVIIQVLPWKYEVARNAADRNAHKSAVDEVQRFIPFLRPKAFHLAAKTLDRPTRDQAKGEFILGNLSYLYRTKDVLRTELIGNYPSFWAANTFLPGRFKKRLLGAAGEGTNRFGARLEDAPYDPAAAKPSDKDHEFTPLGQGELLVEAVQAAKGLSDKPPIILATPIHYEFDRISERERASLRKFLADCDAFYRQVARENACDYVSVPSESVQDPKLWTRTLTHYNGEGHRVVFEALWPQLKPLLDP